MTKAKSVDEKYMGPEPSFNGPISNETELGLALNWYNYFYNADDARPWLMTYMKDRFTKEEIALMKRLPDWKIGITNCSLARMVQRGAVLPDRVVKNMHARILEQIEYAKSLEEKKEESSKPKVVISIQERVKEKAWNIIADIEEELDLFFEGDYAPRKISAYEILKRHDAKTAQSRMITDYFSTILDELQGALDKTDEQLVEAYERLGKKKLTTYRDVIKSIVDECDRFFGNAKKTRTPRKKKAPTTEKLLKHFVFQKESNEFKLQSINPTGIIGAQELWVFNSKNRVLTVFRARGPSGLTVSRTAIDGYDDNSSISKRVGRNTEGILKDVLTGGKVTLRKLMDNISSGPTKLSERINKDTVLLKVVR